MELDSEKVGMSSLKQVCWKIVQKEMGVRRDSLWLTRLTARGLSVGEAEGRVIVVDSSAAVVARDRQVSDSCLSSPQSQHTVEARGMDTFL